MSRWLKLLGTGDGAMDESVVPSVLRKIGFPRRPTIRIGDKIVLYALGHDRAFAVVEAFSRAQPGEGDKAWDRWVMEVREVLSVPYDAAPGLAAVSEAGTRDIATSIRQQSHIGLRDEEYERVVELLRAAGAKEKGFYRP